MTPWQLFLLQQLVDKGTGIVATILATVLGALLLRQLKRNAAERREQLALSPLDAASFQGWARGVDEKLAEHDSLLSRPHQPAIRGHQPLTPIRRKPMSPNTVPQVLDPFVRTARTAIQVLLALVSLAPILPAIVAAIHTDDGSQVGLWLAAAAAWVTTAAGIITRIMAIPTVNTILGKLGLAGHSGIYLGGGDTQTTFIPTVNAAAATDPLH